MEFTTPVSGVTVAVIVISLCTLASGNALTTVVVSIFSTVTSFVATLASYKSSPSKVARTIIVPAFSDLTDGIVTIPLVVCNVYCVVSPSIVTFTFTVF